MRLFSRPSRKSPTRSLRLPCSTCGVPAAELDLFEKSGQWHLRYSGACGSNGRGDPITAERAQKILAAFSEPYESAQIHAAGLYDDAGFCTTCEKFYCGTHWQVSPTGGGRCPAGHFKSLDPHWHPDSGEL